MKHFCLIGLVMAFLSATAADAQPAGQPLRPGSGGVTLTGTESLSNKTFTGTTNLAALTMTGTLNVAADTDIVATIGRMRIFNRVSDDATLGHVDSSGASNWQVSMAQSGNTYLNAKTGNTVEIYNNSSNLVATFALAQMRITAAGTTPSAPSLAWAGDLNTGFYPTTADTIHVSTGGTRRAGWDALGNVDFSGTATIAGALSVGGGATLQKMLSATASLEFTNITANSTQSKTITVTGAAVGDAAFYGIQTLEAGLSVEICHVTATDTVTITLRNETGSDIDPATATWRAVVLKF